MERAIVFPGQGAQFVGMGRQFYERFASSRKVFELADQVLNLPLTKLCFEGPESDLEATDVSQPAILVCSAAIVSALEETEVLTRADFSVAAGLSLGEYSALWFAGALGLEDAIRLVRIRGVWMQCASEASPSGMLALLGASAESAAELCRSVSGNEVLVPANYLCEGNIVLSGSTTAIDRAEAVARNFGVRRTTRLKVAGAFHSELMRPACEPLTEALATTPLGIPRMPVLSNVTARPLADAEEISRLLVQQVTSPVRWAQCIQEVVRMGIHDLVEPGPGKTLSQLATKIDRSLRAVSINFVVDLEQLAGRGTAGPAD